MWSIFGFRFCKALTNDVVLLIWLSGQRIIGVSLEAMDYVVLWRTSRSLRPVPSETCLLFLLQFSWNNTYSTEMYSIYPLQLSAGKYKIILFRVVLCDFRQAQHSKSTATFTRDSLSFDSSAFTQKYREGYCKIMTSWCITTWMLFKHIVTNYIRETMLHTNQENKCKAFFFSLLWQIKIICSEYETVFLSYWLNL